MGDGGLNRRVVDTRRNGGRERGRGGHGRRREVVLEEGIGRREGEKMGQV